jgi:uncharacterized membrane-anchored protein YhcB (DUF1043 family)
MTWQLAAMILVPIATALVGFAIGRHISGARQQILDLEARAELLAKEREHALGEVAARRDEVKQVRREVEAYRGRVVEHFSGSYELLRALTLQYRADFEQLAEGEVAPWESEQLAEPTPPEALPEAAAPEKPPSDQ